MSSGNNLINGLNQGANMAASFMDSMDARKTRQNQVKRQSALDEESRLDRATERENRMDDREYLEKTRTRESDEYSANEELRDSERQHKMDMLPIERQLANLNVEGKKSSNRTQATQARIAAQKEKTMNSQALIRKAMTQMDGGDYEGAQASYAALEEFGYDTQAMSDNGAQKLTDAMRGLIKGDLDFKSPEVLNAAKMILKPALVQSGRDTDRYEIAGLVPSGKGTFFVSLLDKETGDMKPATLNASADEDDPPTQLTLDDLMTGATGMIKMAEGSMQNQINAAAAQNGVAQPAAADPLDALERRADIAKTNAETAEIESGTEEKSITNFVDSYSEFPGLKPIAQQLASEEGFDPDQAIETLAGVRKTMETFDQAAPLEALKIYKVTQEKDGLIKSHIEEETLKNPDVDPIQIEKLSMRWHTQSPPMSPAQYADKLATLKKNAANKKARSETRKQSALDQATKQESRNTSIDAFDDQAAAARGY